MKKTSLLIITLVAIASALSYLEIYLGIKGIEASGSAQTIWVFVFAILTAMWCTEDMKTSGFKAPFEFGAFIYFVWPITLPYYLVKTRGIEGFLIFLGFVFIHFISYILGLVAYVFIY